MHWTNWSEFFAMGGYGLFVWGSFGMCLLVLAFELGSLRLRHKAVRRAALDDADLPPQEARA